MTHLVKQSGRKELKGARKEKGYDVDFVVECLLRLSQMMLDIEGIEEIDVNPFKVFTNGGLALDVRVITAVESNSEN